jgi:hypothetical protein
MTMDWVRLSFGKEVNEGATTINPVAMLRRMNVRAVLIGSSLLCGISYFDGPNYTVCLSVKSFSSLEGLADGGSPLCAHDERLVQSPATFPANM